jgi:hypothetical protein
MGNDSFGAYFGLQVYFGGLGVILCKFYGPLLGWSIIALFKFS